jgi:hypothetical protein
MKGHFMRHLTIAAIFLTTFLLGCSSQQQHHPDISSQASAALHRMSDTISGTKAFVVHSSATMDQPIENGQLAQFTRDGNLIVARPDGLFAEVRKDNNTYKFWHKADEVTILDVNKGKYAVIKTPAPIDEMLDLLAEEHNIVIPLADLLYTDPYAVLTENVKVGSYVDQQTINDHLCHHLLFTQDNVDWQIWIDAGEVAIPRKVVITYKNDPDQPQYEAILNEWRVAGPDDLARLKPQLPTSAQRVELAELLGSDE